MDQPERVSYGMLCPAINTVDDLGYLDILDSMPYLFVLFPPCAALRRHPHERVFDDAMLREEMAIKSMIHRKMAQVLICAFPVSVSI